MPAQAGIYQLKMRVWIGIAAFMIAVLLAVAILIGEWIKRRKDHKTN